MNRSLQRITRFVLVAMAIAVPSSAAHAASHALIMAIDAYEGPEPLPGVALDVPLAVDIARRMGVPQENIVVRRNRQLTLAGMRTSLKQLLARVEEGDQVFLYYSGHGARVANPRAPSGCTEAMVTVNGELLPDIELEQWMSRLGQKAGQLVFMNDSCHAGGAITRDVRFRPKLYKGRGTSECTEPVNVRSMFKSPSPGTPNVMPGSQSSTSGSPTAGARSGPNVQPAPGAQPAPDPRPAPAAQQAAASQPALGPQSIYIAAAKEDEVAYASPEGSVATIAWAACLAGGDGGSGQSTPLTASQLRACAQSRIDQNLKLPRQNITIVGSDQSPVLLRQGDR